MAKGKVLETIVKISGELSPSVAKSLGNLEKKLSGTHKKALLIGAGVATVTAATAKAVGSAGKHLLELGNKFDAVNDSIRIGTGATGKSLEALQDDFKKVYESVPTSMEDASKAVADYNTRLGLNGKNLQDLSKQALQVSDMLGEDLNTTIEKSSKAFQQWGIDADGMTGAMDYAFKVSQSTGIGFNELLNNIKQYGPQLQSMGFSFEEASAMVGQLDKAGVNTNEVLGAMKRSVGTLAKDGKSAAQGMQEYYEKIRNAGSAAEAASIASEIFGQRAGSTMAEAIRKGTLSADDLTASLMSNKETISGAAEDTYDFAERLQMLRQKLEVSLAPIANTIFDRLNDFMPTLQMLLENVVPVIDQVVQAAMPFVDEFLGQSAELFTQLLPLISQLSASLMPILTGLMTDLLPPVIALINALVPPLMDILSVILPPLSSIIKTISGLISSLITALLPPLKSLLSAVTPLLKPLLSVLQPVATVLSKIAGVISKIVGFGANALSKVIGAFGGGKTKELPAYATGGFTRGMSIAGEAGTEAVISFNPAYRAQNLSYWARAGRMLGASGDDFVSIGGGSSTINLGGVSFNPTIYGGSDTDIIDQLRKAFPEFLDMLEDALSQREDLIYA